MSEKELRKRIRAERELRKNIPEGCRWPDCFHCVFYDRNSGSDNGIQDILRELSGIR